MEYRRIREVFKGESKREGAGVKVRRIFDRKNTRDLDPFLMMDFFDWEDPNDYRGGFPWHPHRGIETITYLLQGEVYHEDTLKNKGSITGGECQWMVAASGIMHQELMVERDRFLGLQIWLNMPAAKKMDNPSYLDIREKDLGILEGEGYRLKILAGSYGGVEGALNRKDTVDPQLIDLDLDPNRSYTHRISKDRTLFLFVLEGEIEDQDIILGPGEGVLYERGEGDGVRVQSRKASRVLIVSGQAIGEALAWEGPIAMNTEEELDRAFEELKMQEFIKYRG